MAAVCDTLLSGKWAQEMDQKAKRLGQNGHAQPEQSADRPVERLFPFVLRSRTLLIGRDTLRRSRSKLHFVLITRDISEASRAEILSDFAHYPIVQDYTMKELEKFFGIRGAKVIGFEKSDLAQSIYVELKEHRINPGAPQKKSQGDR
jgi:hypothetical protein